MRDKFINNKTAGSVKISHGVVASIAAYTAKEVDGVVGLSPITSNISSWLTDRQPVRPITISVDDNVAVIEMRLLVSKSARIPEVSRKVQVAVKEAVQNMTGIVVAQVNIHIVGISSVPSDQKDS